MKCNKQSTMWHKCKDTSKKRFESKAFPFALLPITKSSKDWLMVKAFFFGGGLYWFGGELSTDICENLT